LPGSIPDLRSEVLSLHHVRSEWRTSQSALLTLETQHHAVVSSLDAATAENTSLRALQLEVERALREARDRYTALTSPLGEVETQRARIHLLEGDVAKLQVYTGKLEATIEERTAAASHMQTQCDELNAYVCAFVAGVMKMLDAGISGSALIDISAAYPLQSVGEQPAAVSDAVRSATSQLRTVVHASMSDLHRLRAHAATLAHSVGVAQVAFDDSLAESHRDLAHARNETSEWTREADARQLALEDAQALLTRHGLELARVVAELHQAHADNSELNAQNEEVHADCEERMTVLRLWATEMEKVARSLLTTAGPIDAGASSLGAPASTALAAFDSRTAFGAHSALARDTEEWPALRSAVGEVVYQLHTRARGALQELSDAQHDRATQRAELARAADEYQRALEQVQEVTDGARVAARSASAALADSESLRRVEVARIIDESNARSDAMEATFEKIVAQSEEQSRTDAHTILQLTNSQQNRLATTRLLYKASVADGTFMLRHIGDAMHVRVKNRLTLVSSLDRRCARLSPTG
jgi:hypothetical protein